MYDEKVEIQKIFNRMKPYKMKKADQNSLIHLLKHMKVVQNMVFAKDHTFKVDDSTVIKIDIEQDVNNSNLLLVSSIRNYPFANKLMRDDYTIVKIQSKLQLDSIFKSILEDDPKQEVAEIHKQLGTVLQNIVKKMEQIKKEEEEERLKKEAEEKKKLEEEEKKKKKESGIESEDEEEKDKDEEEEEQKNKKPNPNDLFKRQFDQKDLTIEKEEQNKYELETRLSESADAMKWIAKGILVNLEYDDKIRSSIGNKQDKQKAIVKESTSNIEKFLSNKDLGWIQLIFMLLISLSLTIFTITFIHIW